MNKQIELKRLILDFNYIVNRLNKAEKYFEEKKDLSGKGFDPRKVLAPGVEAIKSTVREKIELFGSKDKA